MHLYTYIATCCLAYLDGLHPRQLLLQHFSQLLLLQPAARRNGGCRERRGKLSAQAKRLVEHLGKIGGKRGWRGM